MTRGATRYSSKSSYLSWTDRQVLKEIWEELKRFRLVAAGKKIYWWGNENIWRYNPARLWEKRVDRQFDLINGVDTSARANLDELSIDSSNVSEGVFYQASRVVDTRRIIKKLSINYSDFEFVDIGSGKGRTLLVASEFPFKSVIGVEFAKELNEIAENNILQYQGSVCKSVESILCDATKYSFPKGDLVLYFYNPFSEKILSEVFSKLERSIKENPRSVYIIYSFLPNKLCLEERGFRKVFRWRSYYVFRSP